MITGIKKIHKITQIFFDEENDITTIQTYNTALKNRLTKYASEHPELCRLTDDDGCGQLCFEVRKEYFTFRLLNPCSEDRKQKAREQMKGTQKSRQKQDTNGILRTFSNNCHVTFLLKSHWPESESHDHI